MTSEAFIAAVTALEGLTQAMKDRLVELAPKMSEVDRSEALAALGEASKGIEDALTEEASLYKSAAEELHGAERSMLKDKEGKEKHAEEKHADDLLSNS